MTDIYLKKKVLHASKMDTRQLVLCCCSEVEIPREWALFKTGELRSLASKLLKDFAVGDAEVRFNSELFWL